MFKRMMVLVPLEGGYQCGRPRPQLERSNLHGNEEIFAKHVPNPQRHTKTLFREMNISTIRHKDNQTYLSNRRVGVKVFIEELLYRPITVWRDTSIHFCGLRLMDQRRW